VAAAGIIASSVVPRSRNAIMVAAGVVAGTAVTGLAAYGVYRAIGQLGVKISDIFDGTVGSALADRLERMREANEVRKERRIAELTVSRRSRGMISALDAATLADIPDVELANEHLPFAIKWGQLARLHHQRPTRTDANRIMVERWLYEQWTAMNVRKSDMLKAMPTAVSMAFTKSWAEVEDEIRFDLVPDISKPGVPRLN
jgi:hypothetical protein